MFATWLAQVIDDLGRASDFGLILRLFAIEQAQGILIEAHLAIVAARIQQRQVVLLQALQVLWAAVAVSDAVQGDMQVAQPRACIELEEQADHLSIDRRVAFAQRFAAELVVFAHAPRLWLIVAKHGLAQVVQLDGLRKLKHAMFKVCSHHARRALRSQREIGAPSLLVRSVIETVHLFINDVCAFAGSADEQRSFLYGRRLDAPVSIQFSHLYRRLLDQPPVRLFVRQHIFETLQGSILFGHSSNPSLPRSMRCASIRSQGGDKPTSLPCTDDIMLRSRVGAWACPRPGCQHTSFDCPAIITESVMLD